MVLLDFPFAEGGNSKVRPSLVVQSDSVNSLHTIVAQITSAKQRMLATRLVVDPDDELDSGLKMISLIVCEQLYTIRKDRIIATIGTLSHATMHKVDDCLKIALELS